MSTIMTWVPWVLEKALGSITGGSTEATGPSYRPVWLMLSAALLVGAIGYSITRPALEVFDDLHDSGSEDD